MTDPYFEDDHFPFAEKMPRSERLLIEAIVGESPQTFVCTSLGRAQGAAALAERSPGEGMCHFLDLFAAEESRAWLHDRSRLDIICTADLPEGPFELAAIPVTRGGEAELTREILQQAYLSLIEGGRLIAVVDNPQDRWLHEQLSILGPRIRKLPLAKGVGYLLTKDRPLKRERDLSCEFAFRDQGRLLKVFSRPGVFSHRRLDLGSRALMETLRVESGMRVLDLGCGSGVVSLAAATRATDVTVHAVDSNVRAVECTLTSAKLNGLTNITAELSHEGPRGQEDRFHVIAGNPPYFSQYKIADIFVRTARRLLLPGGNVFMVTKAPEWFVARMSQLFDDVRVEEHRGYQIVRGTGR